MIKIIVLLLFLTSRLNGYYVHDFFFVKSVCWFYYENNILHRALYSGEISYYSNNFEKKKKFPNVISYKTNVIEHRDKIEQYLMNEDIFIALDINIFRKEKYHHNILFGVHFNEQKYDKSYKIVFDNLKIVLYKNEKKKKILRNETIDLRNREFEKTLTNKTRTVITTNKLINKIYTNKVLATIVTNNELFLESHIGPRPFDLGLAELDLEDTYMKVKNKNIFEMEVDCTLKKNDEVMEKKRMKYEFFIKKRWGVVGW